MKAWLTSLTVALTLLLATGLFAAGTPENVLVVLNSNSAVSESIAAYYVAARGIPSVNVATIAVPDSSLSSANEIISYTNYKNLILNPIRGHMSANGLTSAIQFIVLTKGIPHRISAEVTGGTSGGQSVDSMLAAMDLVDPLRIRLRDTNGTLLGSVYANRYWRANKPFSHATYGGYLVTRLDGYTEADAKALVDRATAAVQPPLRILLDANGSPDASLIAAQPKSLLLPDGTLDPDYDLGYSDYDADIIRCSQIIGGRTHLHVTLDATSAFVGSSDPLTAYVSWGSNAGTNYSIETYNSLTFSARAVAETAVSTSGRTFLPTTGGQSLIADLIAQGTAGAKGYVTEPYLDSVASPSVLLDLYTSGRNLAESFYAASRFIGWKDVVIGDPLCSLDGGGGTVAGARALSDGALVTARDVVVTAGTGDFAQSIYVQDPDRISGIRVDLGPDYPTISRGATVTVRGLISTVDGERVITGANVTF